MDVDVSDPVKAMEFDNDFVDPFEFGPARTFDMRGLLAVADQRRAELEAQKALEVQEIPIEPPRSPVHSFQFPKVKKPSYLIEMPTEDEEEMLEQMDRDRKRAKRVAMCGMHACKLKPPTGRYAWRRYWCGNTCDCASCRRFAAFKERTSIEAGVIRTGSYVVRVLEFSPDVDRKTINRRLKRELGSGYSGSIRWYPCEDKTILLVNQVGGKEDKKDVDLTDYDPISDQYKDLTELDWESLVVRKDGSRRSGKLGGEFRASFGKRGEKDTKSMKSAKSAKDVKDTKDTNDESDSDVSRKGEQGKQNPDPNDTESEPEEARSSSGPSGSFSGSEKDKSGPSPSLVSVKVREVIIHGLDIEQEREVYAEALLKTARFGKFTSQLGLQSAIKERELAIWRGVKRAGGTMTTLSIQEEIVDLNETDWSLFSENNPLTYEINVPEGLTNAQKRYHRHRVIAQRVAEIDLQPSETAAKTG